VFRRLFGEPLARLVLLLGELFRSPSGCKGNIRCRNTGEPELLRDREAEMPALQAFRDNENRPVNYLMEEKVKRIRNNVVKEKIQ